MQQVEIIIEGGSPTVKVRGCKGPACKALTKDLEAALGEVKETQPTTEMYEQAKQNAKASY